MQVTKGIWRMREQCVPGSLSSSPAQEPGNEAIADTARLHIITTMLIGQRSLFVAEEWTRGEIKQKNHGTKKCQLDNKRREGSLIPRPSHRPVFVCLQCTKNKGGRSGALNHVNDIYVPR